MTFVSGYGIIFKLFKLEQIYSSILCNAMVLSSTIIIVPKMIEYGLEMPQPQTAAQPAWHREERKGHKVGIIQAVKVQYRYIVPFPLKMNKLCPDKTKVWLDIGPALLVSKLWTICIASTPLPSTTDQTVLVNIPHDLYSMF